MCLVIKKMSFILVGPTVIVAAPVADKKLENYAFQQQLTSFLRSTVLRKKGRLNYSSFVSGIANSICCSLSSPNITRAGKRWLPGAFPWHDCVWPSRRLVWRSRQWRWLGAEWSSSTICFTRNGAFPLSLKL